MESVCFAAAWFKAPIGYEWTGLDDSYFPVFKIQLGDFLLPVIEVYDVLERK